MLALLCVGSVLWLKVDPTHQLFEEQLFHGGEQRISAADSEF
jgi:hypothetical protein